MTKEQKIEAYTMLLDGRTMQEVGDRFGVTRQRIQQLFPHATGREYKHHKCVYPNLAAWLRDRNMSRKKFSELIGASANAVNEWLRGKYGPNKYYIDKILEVTGLTYEEAFYEEVQ